MSTRITDPYVIAQVQEALENQYWLSVEDLPSYGQDVVFNDHRYLIAYRNGNVIVIDKTAYDDSGDPLLHSSDYYMTESSIAENLGMISNEINDLLGGLPRNISAFFEENIGLIILAGAAALGAYIYAKK
jgi:hypothetical protein